MKRRRAWTNNADELEWDRLSICWFGSGVGHQRDRYLGWMAEDASIEVWSHFEGNARPAGDTNRPRVWLEDCSPGLQELLMESLPFEPSGDELSEVIGDVLRGTVSELVHRGEMYLELALGRTRTTERSEVKDAALCWIDDTTIVWVGGQPFQVVPKGVVETHPRGQAIRLNRDRVFRFLPPRRWRRPLSRLRSILPRLDGSQHAWMMRGAHGRSGEGFSATSRAYDAAVLRAVAPTGWRGRGLFDDEISAYYATALAFRWKRFCIELRDVAWDMLGNAVTALGKACGEHPKLVWNGLPTLAQVTAAEQRLRTGPCNLVELVKSV